MRACALSTCSHVAPGWDLGPRGGGSIPRPTEEAPFCADRLPFALSDQPSLSWAPVTCALHGPWHTAGNLTDVSQALAEAGGGFPRPRLPGQHALGIKQVEGSLVLGAAGGSRTQTRLRCVRSAVEGSTPQSAGRP